MPLTLNVGVSRKLGLPHYGSAGATCSAQVELEALAFYEQETLQQRIQAAFDVCRRAVEAELANFRASEIQARELRTVPTSDNNCAESATPRLANVDSSEQSLATERQVDFLYHLARQSRALGGQRLKLLVQQRYNRPIEELAAAEASRLIEILKEVRAGTRSVEELLPEAAA